MKEYVSQIDLFIEILDARVPRSGRNPLFASIFSAKPRLILLNKADLADLKITSNWIEYFQKTPEQRALAISSFLPGGTKNVISLCLELAGKKNGKVIAMAGGIPNAGKSSFINSILKQKKASVQNKPGHTRDFQRVNINDRLQLIDTPGLLWNKFEDEETGLNLAIAGSIKDEILDISAPALAAAFFLRDNYPNALNERYKIECETLGPEQIIELIAKSRGLLIKGGTVDAERAYRLLLKELRDGKLGRISLEKPE